MATNIKFGECLKLILSALDISINRLAKAINVDNSLVNRWIHGKRVPSYNTLYIERISEYLSKNVHNSTQLEQLNNILLEVCRDTGAVVDLQEKIRITLRESQGYSFECKKAEKKESKIHRANIEESLSNAVALSSKDKIIFGISNILSAAISLLETAVNQTQQEDKTVFLTFNSDLGLHTLPNNKVTQFKELLLRTINNGWDVVFLLRLTNNTSRTLKFINFILPFMKTGRLNLYYFKKYGVFAAERELCIISDIGALSCFSTNPTSEISCAFYLESKAAVNILKDYFNLLLSNYAKLLIKYYPEDMSADYFCLLTESEENMGTRYVYNYGLSKFFLPEKLYKKLMGSKNMPSEAIQMYLKDHKRQINTIISNIQNYWHKDIFPVDTIKKLICHRQLYLYTYSGVEVLELKVRDIIEILQNIINILQKFSNYNIAFLSPDGDSTLIINDLYCTVKERHSVQFEAFKPASGKPQVRLSIEEPMLVRAFEEYFCDLWDHIAPLNKDKSDVIAWLQNQLDMLAAEL
ncbi:helix-turn-helix domain-containing protein [Ruminiclostridium cellobioparum]|uniref:helix-turn-helix domain-containing protein n=1 Tax=Ruminiclostridium cellobioparum TaxID=29355 RepID=UPI000486145C|nr:helix-turn-helix transcriptional regulator [Ruminiclostridium cellobioparum]